jgi:1-deoxy-D-xylulose-5-phosphate reductoisomerase
MIHGTMTGARRLILLGATGTVGRQALAILDEAASPLEVVALAAHHDADGLAALGPPEAARFLTGEPDQREALFELLRRGDYEICLNGVVGAAGLAYSEAVLAAGRDLALANKESLVLAGQLLLDLAAAHGGQLFPVDSEHAAIQQCLHGRDPATVRRLYLTASGGALRDLPLEELAGVTPEQALAHPNWDMGPRITVDSATMMNKAFELLEARWLFGVPAERMEVLLHRQSVIHSMVEFHDGQMLAQLGPPDMRFPLHAALHAPEGAPAPLQGFDPLLFRRLELEPPDPTRYPALDLARRAAAMGGDAGAVLNAADEEAVAAFLEGRLGFQDITPLCAAVLEDCGGAPLPDLAAVDAADRRARAAFHDLLALHRP